MFVFCNSEGKIWQRWKTVRARSQKIWLITPWGDRFPPLKVRDTLLDLESRRKREIL